MRGAQRASYCVVGGGISGLVAAYRLRVTLGDDASITVFEPADRLGGVLRTEQVGGQPIDLGAEAFVARRPEVPALLAELGLAARQIGTTGVRPLIFSQGRLHELPRDTLNGIPTDPSSMTGLVDDAEIRRMFDEPSRPLAWRPGADPAVAELVGDRFGGQVLTRSVDPLLAGVYAGSAATIGLRSAAPTLAAVLDRGARNLTEAVREALPPPMGGSVFGAVDGGYAVLVDELVRRADFHWAQVAVERMERRAAGGDWSTTRVSTGMQTGYYSPSPRHGWRRSSQASRRTPPPRHGRSGWRRPRWLRWRCPAAAPMPDRSGVLVAASERLHAKAITLSSRKWGPRGNVELVRLSFGRFGDEMAHSVGDDDLLSWAAEDLADALRGHHRAVRLPGAPVDRRDAAVRPRARPT